MMRIRSSRTIGITFAIMESFAMMTSAPAMAAPNGITYDCDTAADHFSELVLPAPKGPFIVRGQVKVKAIAASEEYVPLTRLAIMEAPEKLGASSQNQAGFSLAALPAGKLGVKTKDKNAVLHFANWDERKAGSEVSHDLFPQQTRKMDGLSAWPMTVNPWWRNLLASSRRWLWMWMRRLFVSSALRANFCTRT